MASYILGVFLAALVATAIVMHYGFSLLGLLPESTGQSQAETQRFAIDYTFWLNLAFLAVTGVMAWLRWGGKKDDKGGMHHGGGKKSIIERVLFWLAIVSYIWFAGGLIATVIK
jgi:heme/copper-type cytochrome/quinol oxidase subunit 2